MMGDALGIDIPEAKSRESRAAYLLIRHQDLQRQAKAIILDGQIERGETDIETLKKATGIQFSTKGGSAADRDRLGLVQGGQGPRNDGGASSNTKNSTIAHDISNLNQHFNNVEGVHQEASFYEEHKILNERSTSFSK